MHATDLKEARMQMEESKLWTNLKTLPEHLLYAYLGNDFEFLVIISSSLSNEEKEKLLKVLRKHKFALGSSISNIKGISPSIVLHKILMEKEFKPSMKHQRRLNATIKKIFRVEILKLLDIGIIYIISNSS